MLFGNSIPGENKVAGSAEGNGGGYHSGKSRVALMGVSAWEGKAT